MAHSSSIRGHCSCSAVILEKEKELIRDYEQRVSELRLEVQRLKTKNMHGTDEWITKIRKLEEENLWMKQVSDKIQTESKRVTASNSSLSQQISTLEADREFLIKQVIAIKKENKHLHLLITENTHKSRQSLPALSPNDENQNGDHNASSLRLDDLSPQDVTFEISPSSSRSHKSSHSMRPRTSTESRRRSSKRNQLRIRPKSAVNANYASFSHYHTIDSESAKNDIDDRYNAVIGQLKKQLNAEKKRSQLIEYKLNEHLSQQNELQTFLKESIVDTQTEITSYMKQQRNRYRMPSPSKSRVHRKKKKALRSRPRSALTVQPRRRNKPKKAKRSPVRIHSHREHEKSSPIATPSVNTMQQRIATNNVTLDEMRSEFSINHFDHDDKKQVLRKLLTKDKILDILYSEMFPTARSIITSKFDRRSPNPVQLSTFVVEDFVRRRDEDIKQKMNGTASEAVIEQKEQQIEFVKKIATSAFD